MKLYVEDTLVLIKIRLLSINDLLNRITSSLPLTYIIDFGMCF